MKRLIFVTLAFLVGCNGMGTAGSRFVPAGPEDMAGARAGAPAAHRGRAKVRLTITIPHRRRNHVREAHPSTISSQTMSVGIGVNGGAAQIFNVTPTSAGCTAGASGTTCTFVISASPGSDTLAVTTYSATGGGGTPLDYGVAVVNVVVGKANSASIKLGPVASSTADSGIGSLRYAVGAANPGDTVMLLLPAGSVITLLTPIVISNNVNIAGPGVTASLRTHGARHANATYSGITLSGGGTNQIFVINPGATTSISGLIMTQGSAAIANQPGGAIYNSGTLALASDVLVDNTSLVDSSFGRHARGARPAEAMHPDVCTGNPEYGGALYNHALATVTSTTFDSNVVSSVAGCFAGKGGAIYNDQFGILQSSTNVYVNNSAQDGGAVFNNSSNGFATFTGDTFDGNLGCTAANGCAPSGCGTPTTTCTVNQLGDGGAIDDGAGPGITVTNSTFENNVVGGSSPGSIGSGGALFLTTGSPTISGSTFSGNQAGGGTTNCSRGTGGAIDLTASGTTQLNNDTFSRNLALGDESARGGALFSNSAVLGSTDTFASNAAVSNGSQCRANGSAEGGAVYNSGGLTLASATFSANGTASNDSALGGGVFTNGTVALTAASFSTNSAVTNGAGTDTGNDAEGGGIFLSGGVTSVSGSTFESNYASSSNPAEYAAGGAVSNNRSYTSTSNTYTSNSVSVSGTTNAQAQGGAVFADGQALTSLGDTYTSNAATASGTGDSSVSGGAIWADSGVNVTNGKFTTNGVTSPYDASGGALWLGSSSIAVNNSTFSGNSSASVNPSPNFVSGGAIDDEGGATISGSVISANTAVMSGGGVYENNAGTLANDLVSGNSVSSTQSYNGGGGVYANGPTVIQNSTISGNSVTVSGTGAGGGGIYNSQGLTLVASTISGNSVVNTSGSAGGAGILNNSGAVVTNSTIANNASSIVGGGFFEYGNNPVTLINDTLLANTAVGDGGNVYNDPGETGFTIANSIFAGGVASGGTGPDIDNNGGEMTSDGYNVFQTTVAGGGTFTPGTGDSPPVNPLLLPLANNGGPTLTNADQSTSPGRGIIPFARGLCNGQAGSGVDQRGFGRGAENVCDAGAYEYAGVAGGAMRTHPVKRTYGHNRPHRPHVPPPHHHPRPAA